MNLSDWAAKFGDEAFNQAVALPFALLVAIVAAVREAGYGHRLSRLYELASKAPEGPEKQFFEMQAAKEAQDLVGAEVRLAKTVVQLIFIFVFFIVLFPDITLAMLSGIQRGYSQVAGRDASFLEIGVVAFLEFLVLIATVHSLGILIRHYRGVWRTWKFEKKVRVALISSTLVLLLLLVNLIRYAAAQ